MGGLLFRSSSSSSQSSQMKSVEELRQYLHMKVIPKLVSWTGGQEDAVAHVLDKVLRIMLKHGLEILPKLTKYVLIPTVIQMPEKTLRTLYRSTRNFIDTQPKKNAAEKIKAKRVVGPALWLAQH